MPGWTKMLMGESPKTKLKRWEFIYCWLATRSLFTSIFRRKKWNHYFKLL